MESHEVLRKAIAEKAGVKMVASGLGLSTSLVYKWCEPSEGGAAAGTENPLDRVDALCRLTGSLEPLHWLCERYDGCFVANPPARKDAPLEPLAVTRKILREFSDLLDVITASTGNDGRIDEIEARRIRHEWEHLKRVAEQFVRACEQKEFAG